MKIIVSTYAGGAYGMRAAQEGNHMEIVGVIGFDPNHRWRTGMRWDFGYHTVAIEQGYGIEYLRRNEVVS